MIYPLELEIVSNANNRPIGKMGRESMKQNPCPYVSVPMFLPMFLAFSHTKCNYEVGIKNYVTNCKNTVREDFGLHGTWGQGYCFSKEKVI